MAYTFYRGADACIIAYDITQASSFDGLSIWHQAFIKHAEPHDPNLFPFAVVGNKSDLDENRSITDK